MTAEQDAEWRATARDWVTIWHSELAAMTEDRELRETARAVIVAWAAMAEALLAAIPAPAIGHEPAPRAAAPAGAAPVAAAPDPRDAELARLAARVAELERRLGGR